MLSDRPILLANAPRSRHVQIFRLATLSFILAALICLLIPNRSGAILLVRGEPSPPPETAARQFDALVVQFKSDQVGYACYTLETAQNGMNCFLSLRCSTGIATLLDGSTGSFGMNFGGEPYERDSRCDTDYFFSQAASVLHQLFGLSPERARDIIQIMDGDAARYGTCDPKRLGPFPEGIGGMTYGARGRKYGVDQIDGSRFTKLFCWTRRES
jgi:hypothetical protein